MRENIDDEWDDTNPFILPAIDPIFNCTHIEDGKKEFNDELEISNDSIISFLTNSQLSQPTSHYFEMTPSPVKNQREGILSDDIA